MILRMSAAEYQQVMAGKAKRSRYGTDKRLNTKEGHFDSKGEYRRWKSLRVWEQEGVIEKLERQIPYSFDVNDRHICIYKADFRFVIVATGEVVVEDFKGKIITPEFNLKRKMMRAFYGIDVRIITKPGEPVIPIS